VKLSGKKDPVAVSSGKSSIRKTPTVQSLNIRPPALVEENLSGQSQRARDEESRAFSFAKDHIPKETKQ
jgi:hypothetical protein